MLTIDSLPVVVRREIPKFVLEHSWRDLSALSQTSKEWHDIAAAELYKNLRIKFRNLPSLQQDISELCRLWQKKDWASKFVTFRPPATEDSFLVGSLSEFHDSYFGFLTEAEAYYQENDWEPIISLISRLQHLRLFNYIVTNMFPTCLYQALERLHPNCQIDIWTPQSPSLDLPGLGRAHRFVSLGCNQPFDLNILSAPRLHTFHAVYTFDIDPENRQRWVHIDEPFKFIFTAPHLKHLIIDARDGRGENPFLIVKDEWQRFTSESRLSPPTVSLDSLTFIRAPHEPYEHILLNISTMIDLSKFRSLDIGVHSQPAILSQVAPTLVGLERLYIHMLPRNKQFKVHWDSTSEDATWDIEEMISTVQAFRPLRFLCMRGLLSFSSLDRILSHHTTLEGLSLEASYRQRESPPPGEEHKYPISNGDHLRSVAKLCPRLAELRLPVQRTKGNARECDIYRALGHVSQLHTVILDLDCDLRPTPTGELPEPGDREEQLPSPAYIRETLINAAIDEALVKSIFDLILSH
ncbi:hypothetical protein BO94DRAFT_629030 [Aspergillus sclerotioniger CBS 115572]|uniref:F-box domain-containing protein n=1 Tax=Aspergillus sclerotioniger CBS 115572 TaxID=1450535 RepID=A0A317UWS5_9EURO|nr:hypothetical protein BO94DRAFT_629030 [Aspergillus sclerotioniger CBS 115572]PWY66473.1 hypothetical protein BO94DRAFT_629030 [Aspergillus sclerotioniger CBS 115572]